MTFRQLAATAVIASTLVGCGQLKNRDEKTLVVHDQAAVQMSQNELSANLDQLRQFIELYFNGDGATRAQLTNLLERYKDKLAKFLHGTKLSMNDLIDLLFSFDANHDGKVGTGEIIGGLFKKIPVLRWIPDNATSITGDELAAHIAAEYPQATEIARDGLKRALLSFDEAYAGGNGDGKLSRAELATAGLILGVLDQTDFGTGLTPPKNATRQEQLVIEQLRQKLNQQLFGRQKQLEAGKLSEADAKLEYMALSLKFYLTDKLTHSYDRDGLIPGDKQAEALSKIGPQQTNAALRQLYDHKIMGGDGDGKLSSIESFALVSDLTFAEKVFKALDGDISAAGLGKSKWNHYVLADLLVVFPRTGQGLALGDREAWEKDPWAIRPQFWDGMKLYDTPAYGGNGDGKIDTGELAVGLTYMRIVENIFGLYDTDSNGILSKEEASAMMKDLGFNDSRMLDAFFADVGLDGGDVSFWDKMKAFFSGRSKINELGPFDFYVRLVKILPRIVSPDKDHHDDHHGRTGE